MLRSLREIEKYKISASDGEIGKVSDFYFDDARWVLRYLVADCSGWLSDKKVLISPISFGKVDWSTQRINVLLTKDKVKNSPDFRSDAPVSRQWEHSFYGYYGWPNYWEFSGDNLWGSGDYPYTLYGAATGPRDSRDLGEDPNLRSVREVTGYHLQARDGEIGHVKDFIWDDKTWAIRYLVIDTRNWLFGKNVLVAPQWISQVNWAENKVHVDLARETIKNSPAWNDGMGVNREYEAQLYDHYSRPKYWATDKHSAPLAHP